VTINSVRYIAVGHGKPNGKSVAIRAAPLR
jgi:hypothetical protein